MRKIITAVVLGLAAAGAFAQQPEADAAEAAKVAAQSWLAQIDGAHYAASWDMAAPAFQESAESLREPAVEQEATVYSVLRAGAAASVFALPNTRSQRPVVTPKQTGWRAW